MEQMIAIGLKSGRDVSVEKQKATKGECSRRVPLLCMGLCLIMPFMSHISLFPVGKSYNRVPEPLEDPGPVPWKIIFPQTGSGHTCTVHSRQELTSHVQPSAQSFHAQFASAWNDLGMCSFSVPRSLLLGVICTCAVLHPDFSFLE